MIDAAEIARRRDYVRNGGRIYGKDALALLDALEQAQVHLTSALKVADDRYDEIDVLRARLDVATKALTEISSIYDNGSGGDIARAALAEITK